MAINKEYLKRRNAKRVYEKNKNNTSNTRKSTDFSFNNAQNFNSNGTFNDKNSKSDIDKTSTKSSINKRALRTNRIRTQYRKDQIARRIQSENQDESNNEDTAYKTVETFRGLRRTII